MPAGKLRDAASRVREKEQMSRFKVPPKGVSRWIS